MADILIRNLDDDIARRLKEKAKTNGASVNETLQQMVEAYVKPSKEEVWAAADALRKKIGKVTGDSTDIIREWRDNKEPYR